MNTPTRTPPSHASWRLRLTALYQPKHPAFWLLLLFNASSSALVWAVQSMTLSIWGGMLLLLFALGNAWWSWRLAQQLWQAKQQTTTSSDAKR